MSLDHLEAIPVDTHVFQIATKYYLPHLKNVKSVTNRVYNEIGDHFRTMYGKYAGWPHCVSTSLIFLNSKMKGNNLLLTYEIIMMNELLIFDNFKIQLSKLCFNNT